MTVDVYGIPELQRKLDQLDKSLREHVDEALDFEVHAMQTHAEQLAPKRTGYLASTVFAELAKSGRDPEEELLNIFEDAWIKERRLRSIAREYHTGYNTIMRLLEDFEPSKIAIVEYLKTTTRRRTFFNKQFETSNYGTVQNYIRRAKREGLKTWKTTLYDAEIVWRKIGYIDPAKWKVDDAIAVLNTLAVGQQGRTAISIRQIAPQLAEKGGINELKVGQFTAKIKRHKVRIFAKEMIRIRDALTALGWEYELTILLLHITTGAREGSENCADKRSGLCGISWDRFHDGFRKVDLFESKVRGGIWSRDCPLDLLFKDLPGRLEKLWKERGRPTTAKVILGGYRELLDIYQKINQGLEEFYAGRLEPALSHTLTTLKPHYSDKIHCNLLWEAEVPLEVTAGEYEGGEEGTGLVGRIWLDTNTIKKYYLTLDAESKRMKKIRNKIVAYSRIFNNGSDRPKRACSNIPYKNNVAFH